MDPRDASPGTASVWRALPWISAAVIFAALAIVTFDDASWGRAHACLPWMFQPIYHDWHVLQLGWQAQAAGIDPLASPSHPYNYPRLLLAGSNLGLQHIPPAAGGLLTAALVLAVLGATLGSAGWPGAVIGAVLLFSQPVLLLLERGNLDAWIVALVVGGVSATRQDRSAPYVLGLLLLLIAALLKLYPAVLFAGGLLAWRGARRRLLGAALLFLVVALIVKRDEIALIFLKTGRGIESAYGLALTSSRYLIEAAKNDTGLDARQHLPLMIQLSLGLYALLLLAAGVTGWRERQRVTGICSDPFVTACFWCGALIYAGTFALGANWSYRLVFLLLCVPWLGVAARTNGVRAWAQATLGLLTVALYAPFHLSAGCFYALQAAEWSLATLLFGGAVAVLTAPAFPQVESGRSTIRGH
jgi:hypothetical protein